MHAIPGMLAALRCIFALDGGQLRLSALDLRATAPSWRRLACVDAVSDVHTARCSRERRDGTRHECVALAVVNNYDHMGRYCRER